MNMKEDNSLCEICHAKGLTCEKSTRTSNFLDATGPNYLHTRNLRVSIYDELYCTYLAEVSIGLGVVIEGCQPRAMVQLV